MQKGSWMFSLPCMQRTTGKGAWTSGKGNMIRWSSARTVLKGVVGKGTGFEPVRSSTVAGGAIYAGDGDGHLHCPNLHTSARLQLQPAPDSLSIPLIITQPALGLSVPLTLTQPALESMSLPVTITQPALYSMPFHGPLLSQPLVPCPFHSSLLSQLPIPCPSYYPFHCLSHKPFFKLALHSPCVPLIITQPALDFLPAPTHTLQRT